MPGLVYVERSQEPCNCMVPVNAQRKPPYGSPGRVIVDDGAVEQGELRLRRTAWVGEGQQAQRAAVVETAQAEVEVFDRQVSLFFFQRDEQFRNSVPVEAHHGRDDA